MSLPSTTQITAVQLPLTTAWGIRWRKPGDPHHLQITTNKALILPAVAIPITIGEALMSTTTTKTM